MKVCPKCNHRYDDANLNFCLNDGEMLMETETIDAPPTIMMDAPRQTNENWGNFDTDYSRQNQPNQQIYQPPFASPQGYSANVSQDQTLPIISIVIGVISVLFSLCYLGIFFGPIALISGFIGMNNANKNPETYGGKSLAIVGMILGGFGMLISFLLILFIFLASL